MDASNDNPEMEYELQEAEALLICMRAETETAAAIQSDMIQILLAVRHNRPILPTPALNTLYAILVRPTAQAGQAIGGAAPHGSR